MISELNAIISFNMVYEGVSKSFWTELLMKYMLTFGITG